MGGSDLLMRLYKKTYCAVHSWVQNTNLLIYLFCSLSLISVSCVSGYLKTVGADLFEVVETVYHSDFEGVWQASLVAIKDSKVELSNKEAGLINTKWIDNTKARNQSDMFDGVPPYVQARFRLKLILFRVSSDRIRLSIRKEQVVLRDMLEGWIMRPSDLSDEQALLYRVGRIMWLRKAMDTWIMSQS